MLSETGYGNSGGINHHGTNGIMNAGAVPCSAKAIYRLADKLGLSELKKRAYDHIIKSLTIQNVLPFHSESDE